MARYILTLECEQGQEQFLMMVACAHFGCTHAITMACSTSRGGVVTFLAREAITTTKWVRKQSQGQRKWFCPEHGNLQQTTLDDFIPNEETSDHEQSD